MDSLIHLPHSLVGHEKNGGERISAKRWFLTRDRQQVTLLCLTAYCWGDWIAGGYEIEFSGD
jgi:hypothetical protein